MRRRASSEPYRDSGDAPASASDRPEEASADAAGAVSPGTVGARHAQDGLFLPLQVSRAKAASLHSDLAAALTLREARARHLAEVPRALDGGRQRNPIHEQAEIQLRQQEALIAVLASRVAAEQARTAELEQALAGRSENEVASADAGPDRAARSGAWTMPDIPGDLAGSWTAITRGSGRPTLPLVAAPSRPTTPEHSPRLVFLAGTLAAAIAAGGAAAVWRGQRDRIVDDAMQLQRRFGLAVIGSIATRATEHERRREQLARRNLGLACLGLLGLFGSLVMAEALELLAPLSRSMLVHWVG